MTPRFNLFFRGFARRYFRHLVLDEETAERLRALEAHGTVVYAMRYASRLDYFLFNTLFLRHGLRLSGFANGIHFHYYRPLADALRLGWRARRERGRRARRDSEGFREHVRALVREGGSFFVFLRTARLRRWLLGRRRAVVAGREDRDVLDEVVRATWEERRPVFVVPLALFWRKGPRGQRRFLNLAYGAPTRPSDFAKVASFLLTYRGLFVKVGDPIDLLEFVEERESEGWEVLARKLRRTLLVHLYREEKVVEGPTLRPLPRVLESVLRDPRVQAAIDAWAREHRRSREAARREAEKMFREIAARMSSTFLALLNIAVTAIFRRIFVAIEPQGLEKVAEYAKRHPLVLVPSHRSYFDFLILSWLFYANHLVPPHIAARENMAFGPFGFLFRRGGAYFLRRSFEDPLYKAVFRAYVAHLVREGFTQEFFIEGGRSRTGRTLAPRLGMLGWTVEAFLSSGRRDLFFVPIAITYERLVEEGAMLRELEGAAKKDESVIGLVRARKVLERRWGSAYVSFGEPISLAEAIGDARERLTGADPRAEEQRRHFVEELGYRIVERINRATIANATSVAATAFLGERRRGLLREELVQRMGEVMALLRLQDVALTSALRRDEPEFREAIAFLLRSDLIRSTRDPRGEILYFEEGKRRALDLYRNAILHFLAPASFLARRLLLGATLDELGQDLRFWLDFFYREFFVSPERVSIEALLEHFERRGAIERQEEVWLPTEKGWSLLHFLSEQTRPVLESYAAACSAALQLEGETEARALARAALQAYERAELLGEVARREGASPVTFAAALETLAARGILATRRVPGKRDPLYAPGPAYDRLAPLRERLAGALAAR